MFPPYPHFNKPGNKQEEYINGILCNFLDLPPITFPEDYYRIQNIFVNVKTEVLGYFKFSHGKKTHSQRTKQLQMKFRKLLNLVSSENSSISVMRAKICEKSLYFSFTKDGNLRYQAWLKKLENQEYAKRTSCFQKYAPIIKS